MRRDDARRSNVPQRRVIVLGASNVIRALPIVIASAGKAWGSPLDILVAAGHGRGYGLPSQVLGRHLPAILDCRLWDDLAERPPAETATLLTDVGNDLLYGATVDQIATWVSQCLERVRPVSQRVVVTELPITSLAQLGPARFYLLRSLFFPRSQLSWSRALDAARALSVRVAELAAQHRAILLAPRTQWFGWDPIHIRRRQQASAWSTILAPWSGEQVGTIVAPRGVRWFRPRQRSIFGIRQQKLQPVAKLKDGSLLSLY